MPPQTTVILQSFKFGLNPVQVSAEPFYQIYQTVSMPYNFGHLLHLVEKNKKMTKKNENRIRTPKNKKK